VETVDIFTDAVKWDAALEALATRVDILNGIVETAILINHRVWSAKETQEELLIPEGVELFPFRPTLFLLTSLFVHYLRFVLRRV
jgi:hypothetical protein